MDFGGLVRSIDWNFLESTLTRVLAVLLCLTVHETCHGLAAYALGDPTARDRRRLSLNPLRHIDWLGLAMTLAVGFGWAKPVPVNPRYFKNPKRGMALTALAGPLSNLLAALLGAFLATGLAAGSARHGFNAATYFIFQVLYYYVVVNISLAVFNLVPVPPLDGSRIVGMFLSDRALAAFYKNQQALSFILMILLVSGKLSGPFSMAQQAVANVIFRVAGLPFGLLGAW